MKRDILTLVGPTIMFLVILFQAYVIYDQQKTLNEWIRISDDMVKTLEETTDNLEWALDELQKKD